MPSIAIPKMITVPIKAMTFILMRGHSSDHAPLFSMSYPAMVVAASMFPQPVRSFSERNTAIFWGAAAGAVPVLTELPQFAVLDWTVVAVVEKFLRPFFR